MINAYDVLLCDLDAFFASVEQRDHPQYRGKPVIVGGSPEGRGVVATCSYEARRYGVRSAMPVCRALELCPEAILLPVNFCRYQEVSAQVQRIWEHFALQIEPVSIDEAYLAVKAGTGMIKAEKIRNTVRKQLDLPLSIGVSSNKLLAKIACDLAKPDGLKSLWPEQVSNVLWPLPVRLLPGVGPKTEKKLADIGVKTVGDLALAPPEMLKPIFGSTVPVLLRYVRGLDDRELVTVRQAKSVSEETTFPQDVVKREHVLGERCKRPDFTLNSDIKGNIWSI